MAFDWIVWSIKSAVWVARFLRRCGGRAFVHAVRSRSMATPIATLHHEVMPEVAALEATTPFWKDEQARVAEQAGRVCTACRDVLAELLDLKPSMLSCRIKLLTGIERGGDTVVRTLASSEPLDGRPEANGVAEPLVCQNTAWSAIMGCIDDHTRWRPMPCFCCNDLGAYSALFSCHLSEWATFYKSILTFPLIYKISPTSFGQIGFLSFDSPSRKAFIGMPETFEFKNPDQWNEYRSHLELNSTYHMIGIMANLIAECMKETYHSPAQADRHLATVA